MKTISKSFIFALFLAISSGSLFPQDTENLLYKGVLYYKTNELDKAVLYLNRAAGENPDNEKIYFYQGLISLRKLDYQNAVFNFGEALGIKNDFSEAALNLGNSYALMNDFENALKTYKTLLAREPENYKAYNNIGNLYKKVNADSAARYYSLALTAQPQSSAASYNLGLIYYSKGQLDLAERYFKMSLESDNSDIKSAYYLGEIYYKRSDYLSSANSYIIALRREDVSHETSPYFEFNDVLLEDASEYVKYVSTVLKPDLNEVQRYYDRAGSELQQGSYKEAAELYYIVASASPNFPQTYYNLGLALEKSGRYSEAVNAYS
ncbi:MAG TPA: tetratricopeptide repeat protein, partial [Ignavibacteriales bacterium]|nr:tetratricopeptide repeat protein [Ignavibacteriales bacterium]